MHRKTIVSACLWLSILLSMAGCGSEEIESRWRDREIKIDGNASEWRGTEQYSNDRKGVRLAVSNDGEFLYMCLTTWNARTQQQILVRGLTVWFDGQGGEEKRYGIEFPMTKEPAEMRELRETASKDRAKVIADLLVRSRNEMIVGRTKDQKGRWMFVEDGKELGIEAALALADRILVYEMKIPLTGGENLPFPGGLREGVKPGLGLEMGKIDMDGMRRQTGEQLPPGGMGGMGGMGGEGPGAGPGGMRDAMEEDLEVWMKVRLAAAQ